MSNELSTQLAIFADFRSLITLVNSTHIFQILTGFSLDLALGSSRCYQY
jgi:hypothetical protein